MDAKPHRPLRPFTVRDENVIPAALPIAKTIHQRNKSSPALSTLARQQSGFSNVGFRRTAFADVSNTARVNQTVKDDSSIASTKAPLVTLRQVPNQENNGTAALAKPAQRPLSVSGIGRFLHNFASNGSTASTKPAAAAATLVETQHSGPLSRARSKKSTAVLRDVVEEDPLNLDAYSQKLVVDCVQAGSTAAPLQVVPTTKTSDHLQQPAKVEASVHSLPPLPPSATSSELDIRSNGVPVQSIVTNIQTTLPRPQSVNLPETQPQKSTHEILQQAVSTHGPSHQPHTASLDPLLELDEHILKEQFPVQHEEDGYTTARSFRSRGDYTTGGTTSVIAPMITERSEREINAARQTVLASRATDEIEEDESWDTSMVAEYGDEIFEYMHRLEARMTPNPYYMDHQSEVQWSMRSVLMDWLIQVHHRFQLLPETLFLCVNYIDRFLSCKVVSINKLQLVGATAILVAAKYEEIQCPTVSEICYMVEGSYKVEEILKAERFMLTMLQFELGWPGPMSFLRRISKADDYDLETRTLAKYFLEVTIMDERFVAAVPSFTAAGAHCLARLMLQKGDWTPAHIYYSGYTYSQLRPLLVAILSCCDDPQKHHRAVFDKYGDKRYKRSSYFVQSELDQGFILPPVKRTSSSSYSPSEQYQEEWRSKYEDSFM